MSKNSFKLSDLDFNNIGAWPQKVKMVFCVLVGFFIVIMAWFLVISGEREKLGVLEGKSASCVRNSKSSRNVL